MLIDSSRDLAPVGRPHNGHKNIPVRRPFSGRLLEGFSLSANRAARVGGTIPTQPCEPLPVVSGVRSVDGPLLLGEPLGGRGIAPVGGIGKRIADIAAAVIIGIVALPLILAVALAVKIGMGGPVFYGHRRVGFGGKEFYCLKFRSMVTNGDEVLARHLEADPAAAEEWRLNRKLTHDPRVTRLGSLLRKSSLDELPQLLNILRGEMSCVGPRPVSAEELERYGAHVHEYLSARPGITGSWQVSGRSSVSYEDRIKLDADYVLKWSFGADLLILLRTVPALLKVDQAA